ncbi:hypothetical protein CSC94_17550 [Zhengella mangrovi]|uniref:Uncharacterized protein n=1 Tax=Zhengella mangrovi TaxID=1982044 RepID=A0A2G1QJF2_9HYPH|nr:hypothetical protein [Zhengella mangrovi]PHP65655.1 hypothetical protein CSC94_17550 [Zhengella mangrovi]
MKQETRQGSWHGRLYALIHRTFGARMEDDPDGFTYWTLVALAALFLAASAIIFVVTNICTLPFGVYARPAWENPNRFVLLFFPKRVPVIAVAVGIYFVLIAARQWSERGLFATVGPFVVMIAVLVASFGGFIALNRLLSARHETGRNAGTGSAQE